MFFLLLIAIAVALFQLAKLLMRTQRTLVPLKHRVLEKKANLEGRQRTALGLLNQFAADVIHYQGYETGLLERYYQLVEQQMRLGASAGQMVTILNGTAPPNTQSLPLYMSKQRAFLDLDTEFQRLLREYNAAVMELNTQKEMFPANIFGDSFFNIQSAVYLETNHDQLLPPNMMAMHLDAVRQLIQIRRMDRVQST